MTNGTNTLSSLEPLPLLEVYSIQRQKLITYLSWDNEQEWRRELWFNHLHEINLLTINELNKVN